MFLHCILYMRGYKNFALLYTFTIFIFFLCSRSDPCKGGIMKSINKGEKAEFNGFILTDKEFDNYKKLLELVSLFKSCKKDYNRVYRSYLM